MFVNMKKRIAAISFAIIYAALVFCFALRSSATPDKDAASKTCMHNRCYNDELGHLKCPVKSKQALVKMQCQPVQSKSVLSKLFAFEFPKLPLEDFFLAAQKALVEKFL
jgi:hypothetical protein